MKLNVKTNAVDGVFTAIDETDYVALFANQKWVLVEFLSYIPYDAEKVIALSPSKRLVHYSPFKPQTKYNYTFQKDGTYAYNKYAIPEYDNGNIYYGGKYHIKDKVYSYNDKFYIGKEDVSSEMELMGASASIPNLYDLSDYTLDFTFDTKLFTLADLQKCLFKLQKQILFNNCDCDFTCIEQDRITKAQRDFIFAAVFVVDYLLSIGNTEEAQRILESVFACGNMICRDKGLYNNTCNCG